MVKGKLQPVVLGLAAECGHALRHFRQLQHGREVESPGLPVVDGLARLEPVHATNHLVDRAEPQLGHYLPQVLGQKEEVVDNGFRLACESLSKLRVLGRNADGAGVQMALAQHDAAQGYQGPRGEPELLCPKKTCDGNVPASLQLTVRLNHDAAAEVVHQQDLVCLRKPQLPRETGVLDGGLRRCPSAAAIAADENHVAVSLGDAGCYDAHAHLCHQLHMDSGRGIDVLQVVDELRQVLNGVDVVVRRR